MVSPELSEERLFRVGSPRGRIRTAPLPRSCCLALGYHQQFGHRDVSVTFGYVAGGGPDCRSKAGVGVEGQKGGSGFQVPS